jgi:hypothetical protein
MEMDDELVRNYRRWLEADESGNDDEADAACRDLFAAVDREPIVPLAFAGQTMEAIADESARQAQRARRTRRAITAGGIAGTAAAAYFGAGLAISAASTLIVGGFDLLVRLIVSGAAGAEAGAGFWSVLSSIGRAASAFVSDPAITVVLLVLQGLAIGALITLQRLLGSDGESYK